jgi:hypothetical protein
VLAGVARRWATVLAAARPLVATDVALEPGAAQPRAEPSTEALDALQDAVKDEIDRLREAAALATEPLSRLDHPANGDTRILRAALDVFQRAGLAGSIPQADESDATTVARAVLQVRAASARFDAFAEPAAAQGAEVTGLDRAPRSAGDVSERTALLAALVRDVFGAPVAVTLPVDLPPDAAPGAGLAPGAELADWLGELSEVRPSVRAWWAASLATEAATGEPATLLASQFPRAEGEGWIGGWHGTAPAQPWQPPTSARHALVAHALEPPTAGTIAGLVVASWVEHVPLGLDGIVDNRHLPEAGERFEPTGVAINVNAPDARPPQSILLAVPPDRTAPTWRLADLLATVLETLELTRFRVLEPPADLPSRSFLPAVFVPEGIEGLSLGLRLRETVAHIALEASTKHWRSFGDA